MALLMDVQQTENESRAAGGISALLKTIGTIGGSTRGGGRGLFMFRVLMIGCSSAAIIGVGTAYATGLWAGTGAIGFLLGSWVGFIGSTFLYYRSSLAHALYFAERYPRLFRMHLIQNFPLYRFEELRLARERKKQQQHEEAHSVRRGALTWPDGEDYRSSVDKSYKLQGMAISSYQTAWVSIEELQEREERALLADMSGEVTAEHMSSATTVVDSVEDAPYEL